MPFIRSISATSRLSKEWKQGFYLLDSDEIEARKFWSDEKIDETLWLELF